MIELRHLRAFRAVLLHGSTTAAAQVLGVSQPSVSRLLAELEAARGETLFARANGRLSPRPAAELLLPEVERMLGALDGLLRAETAQAPSLSVAAPGGIIGAIFGPACRRLRADYPDLLISADVMSYYDTLNAVAMGRVDLGLVKAPVEHPAVTALPLVTVASEVVMPDTHRLAPRAEVLPEDLRGEPLVLLGRHRPFRVQLEGVFEAAGIRPLIAVETQAVSAACGFVRQGMGLTIANALLARAELRAGLVSRPFRADIRHGFCLIHPRKPAQAALIAALAGHLREVIAGMGHRPEPPPDAA